MSLNHSLTGEHVLRNVYDSSTEAVKVSVQPIEFNMELNHTDGDSVYSYSELLTQEVTSGQIVDVSKYSSFTIFFVYASATSVDVQISPTSTGAFFVLSNYTPVASVFNHHTVNCSRMKVTFAAGQCFICARV